MSNKIPVSGAAAGDVGSPYLDLISSSCATGNYVINDTNFTGIGPYIPGWMLVVASQPVANVTLSVSTDNGTSWAVLSQTGGGFVYVDSGNTIRVNVATATNTINLFPLGNG